MGKINFKNLVKSLEFLAVVGLSGLGWFTGGVGFLWALLIAGGYIALNLLGLATKPTQDVIDDIKEKITEKKV